MWKHSEMNGSTDRFGGCNRADAAIRHSGVMFGYNETKNGIEDV